MSQRVSRAQDLFFHHLLGATEDARRKGCSLCIDVWCLYIYSLEHDDIPDHGLVEGYLWLLDDSVSEPQQYAFAFTNNFCRVGLAFLANGLGCVSGSILAGKSLNATFRRESSLWRHFKGLPDATPIPRPLPITFPIERARLSEAPMYSVIQILGLIVFGWSLTSFSKADPGTSHWMAPLIAQFAIGYSNTAVLNSNNTLIVDLYPGRSASASAVINLTRNLTAAVGVAVADYITAAMSPGWFGTLLAGIVLVGMVPYFIHSNFGPRWRERRQSSTTGL